MTPEKKVEFSDEQEDALSNMRDWVGFEWQPGMWYYLQGPAGTGKTTIAKDFYDGSFTRTVELEKGSFEQVVHRVQYGSFTGKAASVMRKKGCIGAATLHSLIYKASEDPVSGDISYYLNSDSVLKHCSLVVIDECSMCDEEISKDLLSFRKPLIVIGDKHQLPPIEGTGYFTGRMPDFSLTEIHRQARDNPIIAASMAIREGKPHGLPVEYEGGLKDGELLEYDQILVGTNANRTRLNRQIRRALGRKALVEVGEKLICLKNDRKVGCFNGTTWQVVRVNDPFTYGDIKVQDLVLKSLDDDSPEIHVMVPDIFFTLPFVTKKELNPFVRKRFQEFTYGYAMTVHKAQGSQWDNVLLFDDSRVFKEYSKNWLYTGVTRAAEKVKIVK